jgi:catechol 2,3-dioxygenase-like lactoylglutathione lyase family enzyme
MKRSAEWYARHLGFRNVTEDPLYLEMMTDTGVRILFQQNDHGLHSDFTYPDGSPQSAYGFIVDDAEALYRELKNSGIKVGKLFDYQGKSFSFYDPDGNYIEIWSLPSGS